MKLPEVTGAAHTQLAFDTIGIDEENSMRPIEIFQEQRLTQQLCEGRALGDEFGVGFIGNNHIQIKIGVCIRCASGIGAAQKGGDYAFIDGVYGHQYLARRTVARALAQKIEDEAMDLDRAKEVARWLFVDNPMALFNLKSRVTTS